MTCYGCVTVAGSKRESKRFADVTPVHPQERVVCNAFKWNMAVPM